MPSVKLKPETYHSSKQKEGSTQWKNSSINLPPDNVIRQSVLGLQGFFFLEFAEVLHVMGGEGYARLDHCSLEGNEGQQL